jgi:hypothetical protein
MIAIETCGLKIIMSNITFPKDFGPPYGVVGPLCPQGNTAILTHDFTHRTHLKIFYGDYYPPELTDCWLDDWISRVYGSNRTRQLANVAVNHHTAMHGSRYKFTPGNDQLLHGLIQRGRQQLREFMIATGVSRKKIRQYERSRFDNFPLQR